MGKKKLLFLFCVIVYLVSMVIPTFAQTNRASDQISDYWVVTTSSDREINVEFSVTGTGSMNRIGCESIYIYENSSGRLVENFDENDYGMIEKNARKFVNMVSADCKVGTRYKVVVTIFAENSAGRDTRSQTFYVTGQA